VVLPDQTDQVDQGFLFHLQYREVLMVLGFLQLQLVLFHLDHLQDLLLLQVPQIPQAPQVLVIRLDLTSLEVLPSLVGLMVPTVRYLLEVRLALECLEIRLNQLILDFQWSLRLLVLLVLQMGRLDQRVRWDRLVLIHQELQMDQAAH